MAYVKDLWVKTVKNDDDTTSKVKTARYGNGKRWLAGWIDPDGREKSKAFERKVDAETHAKAMETDVSRGDYLDVDKGKRAVDEFVQDLFKSKRVVPGSMERYEQAYRLHVKPKFGHRQIKGLKTSEIRVWLNVLSETMGFSTVKVCKEILQGALDIAVEDEAVRKNVARSRSIQLGTRPERKIVPWHREQLQAVIDFHAGEYRPIPVMGMACGMRQGEAFAFALEDIDFDAKIVHVRCQLKRDGKSFVFGFPKGGKTRKAPMPDDLALLLREHVAAFPPTPITLPWETAAGKPTTRNLLFVWRGPKTGVTYITARAYSDKIWWPALVHAGLMKPPKPDARGRKRYETDNRNGFHALRHYFASAALQKSMPLTTLAEILGHSSIQTTATYYAHLMPDAFEYARKAAQTELAEFKIFFSHGTLTGTESPSGGSMTVSVSGKLDYPTPRNSP